MTKKPTQRCGGIFVADPDVPPDPLDRTGRRVCRCGLLGEPGDATTRCPRWSGRTPDSGPQAIPPKETSDDL